MLTTSTLESIELSPDPPQAGKNLTVTVRGRANEKIEVRPGADAEAARGCVTGGDTPPAHKH